MTHFALSASRHAAAAALIAGAALLLAACGSDSASSLMASGEKLAAKKDYAGAVIQFKTALQKDPESAEARYLLGKALLDSADPAAAQVELSRAFDQKFDPNKVVPALARAHLLMGDYAKITTLYGDMALSDNIALASLKSTVATAWAMQNDRAKLEAALAAALQAAPKYPPALVLQARLVAGEGKLDEATVLIKEALALDKNLHDAWHLQGEILSFSKKDEAGAEAAFRESLRIEPAYLPAHMALVQAKLNANDLPAAQAQVAAMRKVLPKHPLAAYVDAIVAFRAKEFDKARALSQALLRALPDNTGVLQLAGSVEGQLGSLIVAESHFAKALQIAPNLHVARRNLGQVYLRLGQPAKTLETLAPMITARVNDPDVYALAGEAQLMLNNPKAAEEFFRQAVVIRPDSVRVRTALALTNLARGDAQAAFTDLQSIASADAQGTFADQAIISARLSRREFAEALKAADALLLKTPGKASALEMRGRIHWLKKDLAAARTDFEAAQKADPAYFAATVNLAALDLQENKAEQARKRLEDSILSEPKNYYARLALAELRQRENAPLNDIKAIYADGIKMSPAEPALRLRYIDLLLSRRQFKEALAAAQDASAAMPADQRVLEAVGRAQAEAGDIEQAISTFSRLADTAKSSALPYVRLAEVYRAADRKPAAEGALRKALELEPESIPAQQALVSLFLSTNKLQEAVDLARKLQQQRPRAAAPYVFEANVHFRRKQPDAALAAFRRGLDVKEHDPEIARQYYLALYRAGRPADADKFGEEWMKARPNDVVFDYQLAMTSLQKNDLDRAEERLQRIVQGKTDYAPALNNLAWILATRGKPGGVALAQRALEKAPDNVEFMDTLALALLVEKQAGKALDTQRKVVELRPNDSSYRLSLAKIAIEAGDKTLARAELERLAALGAAFPRQAEVKALQQKL